MCVSRALQQTVFVNVLFLHCSIRLVSAFTRVRYANAAVRPAHARIIYGPAKTSHSGSIGSLGAAGHS